MTFLYTKMIEVSASLQCNYCVAKFTNQRHLFQFFKSHFYKFNETLEENHEKIWIKITNTDMVIQREDAVKLR